jgi:hypothetical protein
VEEISYTNIWLNATMEVCGKSNWVLTDTRFPNEGSGISKKGIVLRIQDLRTDIKDRTNLHESGFGSIQFTGIINNTKICLIC